MIQMQCFNNVMFTKVYTGGQNLTKTRRTQGLYSHTKVKVIIHHPEINIQSSFTHPRVVPNTYNFHSSSNIHQDHFAHPLKVHATKMFMFQKKKKHCKNNPFE